MFKGTNVCAHHIYMCIYLYTHTLYIKDCILLPQRGGRRCTHLYRVSCFIYTVDNLQLLYSTPSCLMLSVSFFS